uniref:Uncharacterized protein n=1 Tax=Kalanchoe fedtschenkoi TaxID=63787 RepID=A0A7N0VEJ7_KALFE
MEILKDDDGFGGSDEEQRIFKETFSGIRSSPTSVNSTPQFGKCSTAYDATSVKNLTLLSVKEVLMNDLSNGCDESEGGRAESGRDSKRMKSSASEVTCDKTSSISDLSSQQVGFQVVEYSKYTLPSSSRNSVASSSGVCKAAAEEPIINLSVAVNNRQNKVSNQEHNECKESAVLKQVTSPASQESCATKAIVPFGSSSSKCSRKENEEDDELFGGVSLKDTRDQLYDHVNRLMEALGWHVEVRQRNCRTYKEKVYISATGKRVREFPKLWRLLGRSLDVTSGKVEDESPDKVWTDLGHFCADLNQTLSPAELKGETTGGLARVWNILDPFVALMFIDRKIGALRKGTAIRAMKSIPENARVKNNGDLSFDEEKAAKNKNPENNGKLQASSSASAEGAMVVWEEKIGSGRILSFGKELNPEKSHRAGKSEPKVGSRGRKTRHFKDGGDCDSILLERASGIEGGLTGVPLYDVHIDGYNSEVQFLELSNAPLSEQIEFEKESGTDEGAPHSVTVFWKKQEDVTRGKKTETQLDVAADHRLGSSDAGAVKAERSLVPCKRASGQVADEDVLLATIKKKTKRRTAAVLKVQDPKRKGRGRGRGRSLQPRGKAGQQPFEPEKCISSGARTTLSWLIDAGVIRLNEKILYRTPQSDNVAKEGLLTSAGILCCCCGKVYSVSNFQLHAGTNSSEANSNEARANLIMGSGKSYALCQLEGWCAEYTARKNHKAPARVENDDDDSDDICGLCGDGGDLICCDNCLATFHETCLPTQDIPEGDWYCPGCVCHICGEFSTAGSSEGRKCALCEHKYHAACLKEMNMDVVVISNAWFCGKNCHEIFLGMQSRIGAEVPLENGYSSTLLKCFHEDSESRSQQRQLFETECNAKLAVALTIMEECFLSMVDSRTGIDMIPHMLYNFGSDFPRLDFHGFYSVVLEKDDVVLCVASLRIHGSKVAEIPLVATCGKYRRQGMCRLLMGAIEAMLMQHRVEKILISAVPELVPTWVNGFAFQPVKEHEQAVYKSLNLVVLPGTILLEKTLLETSERALPLPQPQAFEDPAMQETGEEDLIRSLS